jgi:hypothetical protein
LNTAAIPEAKGKTSFSTFHLTFSTNSFVCWVAVTAIDVSIFSLRQMEARISSASSNYDVKYNGTECSKYWVRSNWVDGFGFKTKFFFVHSFV